MSDNISPGQETIPRDIVVQMFREVQEGMQEHAAMSLSQIFFPKEIGSECLEGGTGSFVDVDGAKLLLSNDHVIRHVGMHYSLPKIDRYVSGAILKYGQGAPIDVGVSRIGANVWAQYGDGAFAIPLSRFAQKHATCPREILWFGGYPGARTRHLHHTFSVAQLLPTQEYIFSGDDEPHEAFDPQYHFGVAYNPSEAEAFDQENASGSPGLSIPPGLSGSLVWNTRRLEYDYAGRRWDPTVAMVTGIIWGWPSRNYLIATKVEHFREMLAETAVLPSN